MGIMDVSLENNFVLHRCRSMTLKVPSVSTSLSVPQFTRIGLGMWGGPRGTYGKYQMGPVTQVMDMKNERERQSGE